GNGALLGEIGEACPQATLFGVEWEPELLAHARELQPAPAEHFIHGNMFDVETIWPAGRRFALALLMPGRLLEVPPERAANLRVWLRERCKRTLVYAYDEWLTRFGDLTGLARAAGLELVGADAGPSAALATVVDGTPNASPAGSRL